MSLLRRTPDRRARVPARRRWGCACCCSGGSAGAVNPASAAQATQEKGLKAWWYYALGLEKAHRETTGTGVKIAVIDEAIDPTAPELPRRERQAGQGL